MEKRYNEAAFTPDQVKEGLLQDLLNYLLAFNQKSHSTYYDIHITTDSYCTIVEWATCDYDQKYGGNGQFQFVDEGYYIMKEVFFPDNHVEFLFEEEEEEALSDWLEENPGWEKDEYGRWYNKIENEKFLEELKKEKEEFLNNGEN